jgi:hypothetical protein
MNWLGKVFVVLILIMSIMFMGLAMAVWATHKNWKATTEALKTQLDTANANNEQLKTEHNRRVEELDREKTAAEQQVVKLEAERASLVDRNNQIQTELDGYKQNQRDHIAAVASTQKINEGLATEVTGLRQQIRQEEQARDAAFTRTLEATEELHQVRNDLENATERSRQLTRKVAGMTEVMRAGGIDPATEPGSVVPTVEGVVSQIRRTAGAQLVEVTIGSDDGLKEGNTLEVSRGSKYLGRLAIIQTSPDKSVGRVDRKFQQGQIQEGDRVRTRFEF